MAADDDVADKFDASEPAIPSVSETNAELQRLAAVRVEQALAQAEQRLAGIRTQLELLSREVLSVTLEIDNWIELLRGLRAGKE